MPYSEQSKLARKGRDGDTRLGHLSDGDVIVSRERQERDPKVKAALRELMGDDLERFTVGSAWNSRNPSTGLAEFADPAPEINPAAPVQPGASAAAITNSPTAGPTQPANKGAAAPTDTSLGGDASNPWTPIFAGLQPSGGPQQPQPRTGQSEAYSALGGNNPLNLEAARTLAEGGQ